MTMESLATGYGLIEGPVWRPGRGLYFSDVVNGGVFLLSPSGAGSTAIPHRRGIGGMALHATGGLVVGGRNIAFKRFGGDDTVVLLDSAALPGAVGFNDLTTDAAGRIYVGSLAFRVVHGETPKPGHLHVIDLDGTMRTISDGVMLTNGLGFSPDGTRLYHSDSRSHLVRVYDVRADGSVGGWRPFATVTPPAIPDGLAVAEDGSVWVALADGGVVLVLEPDGSERARLPVPLPMVTSVCFGGDDLRDLYVVTGSRGGPGPNCGTVYRTRVDVPGLPRPLARVALPS
ncbi:MAG: SMP-30/gluconolactonase/LRE family protein [Candidatus Rokubacteria bacterium]|nr:SMP-30/gluconolactonase/LRE family protein [Candidatus Rokubacteria bacterium]